MKSLMHVRPEAEAFALVDLDEPAPAAGEVVVAVDACGICGSDLTVFHTGSLQAGVRFPRPLGHEFAGQVVAAGDGAGLATGTWVVVNPHVRDPDCDCGPCRRGQYELCARRPIHGVDLVGGFTPLVTTRPGNLVPVSEDVARRVGSIAEPLACGVHAMDRADVQSGELVVVLGAGPIGILAAVAAQHRGADVVLAGLGADEARLAVGAAVGLETVRSDTGALAALVAERGDGADVVVEAAGAQAALNQAVGLVRHGGRVLLFGIQHEPLVFEDPADVVLNEKSIITTRAHRPASWVEACGILAARTDALERIVTERLPLEAWSEAFGKLERREALKISLVP